MKHPAGKESPPVLKRLVPFCSLLFHHCGDGLKNASNSQLKKLKNLGRLKSRPAAEITSAKQQQQELKNN